MKNTSCLTVLAVLLVFPVLIHAQSARVAQLENQLISASGPTRAQVMITLSEAYFEEGQAEKAEDMAEDAADFSKKIKQPMLRAIALNREGKAMVAQGKKKAAGRFEESLDILNRTNAPDKALMLDNLQRMRGLALANGRQKDLLSIDEKIAYLSGNGSSTAPATPEVPVTRMELRQELLTLKKELAAKSGSLAQNEAKLMEQSQRLQAELEAREAQISKMSAEQVRTEMMYMQQRMMLDSVLYLASMDSMAVSNAQLALGEANAHRNALLMGIIGALLLAGGALFSYFKARQSARLLAEKNNVIRQEQERSENLLLNILPSLVANELKQKGRTDARFFEDVSVLFADFVGFSGIAEKVSPQQLVSELDACFQAFDEIIARYGLEKIKTIGDCYMCAGGVPDNQPEHLKKMVLAAREMQQWLFNWNETRVKQGLPRYDARIGIHRGPVVAGVVGSKKFAFDIWGDTVNIAARIEQAGEGGKINISGDAYAALQNDFSCQYRGKIPVKNRGEIDMYYVLN